MAKIIVGVLRGGPSSEYEISLLTGQNVLNHLAPDKYETRDILVSKDGVWHENGFPSSPDKIFQKVDVIFNAMHGEYGEDGKVQQVLEAHSIPYTGSRIVPSAMAMQKTVSKDIFQKAGLKVPRGISVRKSKDLLKSAEEVRNNLFQPWLIKPASRGSSVGVNIAHNVPEIVGALNEAFMHDDEAIAEEYIKGREVTCGILDHFRKEEYYALPVIEIIPPIGKMFDYENKYNGRSREICPANLDLETSKEVKEAAILAHKALGMSHYSRSDFIISNEKGRSGIYILETNSLPGLTSESLVPKAAEAIGLSLPGLLDHLVSQALNR